MRRPKVAMSDSAGVKGGRHSRWVKIHPVDDHVLAREKRTAHGGLDFLPPA